MRLIVISAIAISLIGVAPQIAHPKQTYTLQQYPEGLVNVPCSAFKRTPNGSWKEVAVFIFHGSKFTGNTPGLARGWDARSKMRREVTRHPVDRREFIAAAGSVTAVASASQTSEWFMRGAFLDHAVPGVGLTVSGPVREVIF
jgi:hypothetical protein